MLQSTDGEFDSAYNSSSGDDSRNVIADFDQQQMMPSANLPAIFDDFDMTGDQIGGGYGHTSDDDLFLHLPTASKRRLDDFWWDGGGDHSDPLPPLPKFDGDFSWLNTDDDGDEPAAKRQASMDENLTSLVLEEPVKYKVKFEFCG